METLPTHQLYYPWHSFIQELNEADGIGLLKTAWDYRTKASAELKIALRTTFRNIPWKGWRKHKILDASFIGIQAQLRARTFDNPLIAHLMIALWLEANDELVQQYRKTALEQGIRLRRYWDFRNTFLGSAADLTSISKVNDALLAEGQNLWKVNLLSYWFAGAVLAEGEIESIDEGENTLTAPESEDKQPAELLTNAARDEKPSDYSPPVDLMSWQAQMYTLKAAYADAHQAVLEKLDNSRQIVHSGAAVAFPALVDELKQAGEQWAQVDAGLRALNEYGLPLICQAVQQRRDIDVQGNWDQALNADTFFMQSMPDQIAVIDEYLQKIQHYDQALQDTQKCIEKDYGSMASLAEELTLLSVELPPVPTTLDHPQNELLIAARERLEKLRAHNTVLQQRLNAARQNLIDQITMLVSQIAPEDISSDQPILGDWTLHKLQTLQFKDEPSSVLTACLTGVRQWLDRRIQEKAPSLPPLIQAYRQSPNANTIYAVMNQLAYEHRDLELVLLVLSLSARSSGETYSFGSEIVNGLLRGLDLIADKRLADYELVNLLADSLLRVWQPEKALDAARIRLLCLAAHCLAKQRMPDEALWKLGVEWELAHMPTWAALWELALTVNRVPLIAPSLGFTLLDEARHAAEQSLLAEHGVFQRVSAIKSKRHTALMNQTLLPVLAEVLKKLRTLDDQSRALSFEQVNENDLKGYVDQINELVDWFDEEKEIPEWYDEHARKAGIDDKEPFHRTKCLRILGQVAGDLLTYADQIIRIAEQRAEQINAIPYEKLAAELQGYPELLGIGTRVLDLLANRTTDDELPAWNTNETPQLAYRFVVESTLRLPGCCLRLPGYAARLSAQDVPVERWFENILQDLENALPPDEAGALLIREGAPSHALRIAELLPLDLQREAGHSEAQFEREINRLEDELVKLRGETPDLYSAKEARRWGYVIDVLQTGIRAAQTDEAEKNKHNNELAFVLFDRVQIVQTTLFKDQSIPIEARREISRGLTLAQEHIEERRYLGEVREFLDTIEFRIGHRSWSMTDIHMATDKLNAATEDANAGTIEGLTIDQILYYLEQNEQRQLGIGNADRLEASEIGTRMDVLTLWLELKTFRRTVAGNLSEARRAKIDTFYSRFVRMCVMNVEQKTSTGIFPYWKTKLRIPQAAALGSSCFLVAVPGLGEQVRKQFMDFIESEEWLEEGYAFVIAFIPDCPSGVRERLKNEYAGRGLVIIDETALLTIVLAEQQSSTPIGRLRPMMMNAKDLQNIAVFKYDTAVDGVHGLFVGRRKTLEKLTSNNVNYALYGGRRIGKSSLLLEVKQALEKRGARVIYKSFEGEDLHDVTLGYKLMNELKLTPVGDGRLDGLEQFKVTVSEFLSRPENESISIVLLLDEVDRYLEMNPERQRLIEVARSLTDQFSGRFRVIVAGFMVLYDYLRGRSHYKDEYDPWRRMFEAERIGNLDTDEAETLVEEGFRDILGWRFKNRLIPQRIFECTGGHPAFVQSFCRHLQRRVGERGDQTITLEDVEAVYENDNLDKDTGFTAHVASTLQMNLDPVAQYVVAWLSKEDSDQRGFTRDQMASYASLCRSIVIDDDILDRSLDLLDANSVIIPREGRVYNFSVPDYPRIIGRMQTHWDLTDLEQNAIPEHIREIRERQK